MPSAPCPVQPRSELPVRAGAGPFRTKGLAYRNTFHRLRSRHGEGSILAHCEDPSLRDFFARPFSAASWYDVFPIVELVRIGARLEGATFSEFCRTSATQQAEDDLNGVYRVFLSVISPELALRAILKVTQRYFDFGGVYVDRADKGHAILMRTGIPTFIDAWYAQMSCAYVASVMRASGARDVEVSEQRVGESRDRGFDVCDQRYVVRWS